MFLNSLSKSGWLCPAREESLKVPEVLLVGKWHEHRYTRDGFMWGETRSKDKSCIAFHKNRNEVMRSWLKVGTLGTKRKKQPWRHDKDLSPSLYFYSQNAPWSRPLLSEHSKPTLGGAGAFSRFLGVPGLWVAGVGGQRRPGLQEASPMPWWTVTSCFLFSPSCLSILCMSIRIQRAGWNHIHVLLPLKFT